MNFTPQLKSKRFRHGEITRPFPTVDKASAIFTGYSIEVVDKRFIIDLYENGNYGKGSHSRSAPVVVRKCNKPTETAEETEIQQEKIEETLVLGLEEAFFLKHSLGILDINDLSGCILESEELFEKFIKIKSDFPQTYATYLHCKSRNWIIKCGRKFGGNFLLYKSGPRFYHASFVIYVTDGTSKTQKDIQGLYRVAETSDKDGLFLEVHPPKDVAIYNLSLFLDNLNRFKIYEWIPKRLDFKQYVQVK